ncbi:Cysteine-type peptidase [Desmophyllum pertusum]|uniref:Cysteine-type peptidase n=1 Tax=Desmophyllum pertusum TaxID=174260 RepID=A0A9X0D6N8_9CNID|nr:Cysteine-type peptidase [Desmophyllum pertusum]
MDAMDALCMTINAKRRNARLKYVVQYPSYGCFTIGRRIVRILSRYDTLRTVVKEVREEEKWLEVAFKELPQTEKHLVSEALLDNWNEKGQYLVQLKWYNITSQELSVLCCERYLNDEVINLLINTFCDAANERHGRTLYTMLSSYISTNFQTSAVQYIYANVDMSTVEIIFLPIHLNGNHWGLLVFDANNCFVGYDYRFHYPVTLSLQDLPGKIITVASDNRSSTFPTIILEQSAEVQSANAKSTKWLWKLWGVFTVSASIKLKGPAQQPNETSTNQRLKPGEAVVIVDYKMKLELGMHAREIQRDWYDNGPHYHNTAVMLYLAKVNASFNISL